MLPKIIKDAILTVEGRGYAGIIDNIEWPKITRKTDEYRAGGMFGPVDIDLGQEKMELAFEAKRTDGGNDRPLRHLRPCRGEIPHQRQRRERDGLQRPRYRSGDDRSSERN